MFSRRSGLPRAPNALARAVAARREADLPILDLTVSNPTRVGLDYPLAGLLEALSAPAALDYAPEPLGLLSARQAVSDEWQRAGLHFDPSQILLTASTSEAYAILFKLLCEPGDEVLIPQPSYPLFEHLARFESVRPVPYPLRYDGAWHLDVAALEQARSSRTRALLVVSPNNPTGNYLSRDELSAIEALGLPIVCDEVFADYPLRDDPGRAATALQAEGALVFALGGLSKRAGLPGLKLGWTTAGGPPDLVKEAMERLELIADAFLSPATPVQVALPRILELCCGVRDSLRDRVRTNLATLTAALEGSGANALRVEGGWYALARLPAIADEESWVLALLEHDGVLVQPGYFYDFSFEPVAVISLITPPEELQQGVARLRARVDAGPEA